MPENDIITISPAVFDYLVAKNKSSNKTASNDNNDNNNNNNNSKNELNNQKNNDKDYHQTQQHQQQKQQDHNQQHPVQPHYTPSANIYDNNNSYNFSTSSSLKTYETNRKKMSSTTFENQFNNSNSNKSMDLMTNPTFDPNYIMRHAAFDPSILLYGIRGEYERKFQQYQQLWRQKWEELDQFNKELHRKHAKNLKEKIEILEDKYFNKHYEHLHQPCYEYENQILNCYENNSKQPLLCNRFVDIYTKCIDMKRLKLLKMNTTDNNSDNNNIGQK